MRCEDLKEHLLLATEVGEEIERHVAECLACSPIARGLRRLLDSVLSSSLLVQPPLELQRQLAQLVLDAAAPAPVPWWSRVMRGQIDLGSWLLLRPHVIAAQGLAAMMLALASWQVFGFLNTMRPVVGDVGYAMQLVAASPAAVYVGGFPIDLQSLALWSLVGIGGWLISENGVLGRRLAMLTQRLPKL